MKIIFFLACFLGISLSSGHAMSADMQIDSIPKGMPIRVTIIDNVSGDCWTNSETILEETAKFFKDNGIVVRDDPDGLIFEITVGGGSYNGTCYVVYKLLIIQRTVSEVFGEVPLLLGSTVGSHVSGEGPLDEKIESKVADFARGTVRLYAD